MTRKLLLIAACVAWTTPLAADDGLPGFADRDGSVVKLSASQPATVEVSRIRQSDDTETDDSPSPYLVTYEFSDEDEGSAKTEKEEFLPICDWDCLIPPLDTWCDCDLPSCTTDCWVSNPCECSHGNCYWSEQDCQWMCNDKFCDIGGDPLTPTNTAIRLGWWAVDADGSPTEVGQFQDLNPSPFWDVDAVWSNGRRTLDLILSGLDNEANFAQGLYYGPELTAKVRFDRFLKRVDHDPLQGFEESNGPPGPADNVVVNDLNVGEDYAIRVERLDARFHGRITDNLKWRLNVWGQRKFGERQANATAHCFNVNSPNPAGANGNVCHVLSQRQNIDWLTMEIEPVLEARFERVTVEYSRTMRSFGQSDQIVDRTYSRFNGFNLPSANGFAGADYDYALVPENFTQIDQLKAKIDVTENSQLYANMYLGDTENKFRDMHRRFSGYDVRLTDRSIETLTSSFYVNNYDINNETPPFFFNAAPLSPPTNYDEDSNRHPVDYCRTRVGWKGNWRPSCDFTNGFSMVGGYEYGELARDYAQYETELGTFIQDDTRSHTVEISPQMRWSPDRTTYVRYKVSFIEDPLLGVREHNGRFNTNQPEQVHSIDIGGTWAPYDNLVATAQFSFVSSWHSSPAANFNEDSYPLFVTILYAPTHRLSLTGGYFYNSNWIDQDITLGFLDPGFTETTHWNYRGQNHLFNINAAYLYNSWITLTAGYEWDRGTNIFSVPPSPAGADWSAIPFFSDVAVETQRATLGVDLQPYDNVGLYFRYVLYDWNDIASNLGSGTTNMVLAGGTASW